MNSSINGQSVLQSSFQSSSLLGPGPSSSSTEKSTSGFRIFGDEDPSSSAPAWRFWGSCRVPLEMLPFPAAVSLNSKIQEPRVLHWTESASGSHLCEREGLGSASRRLPSAAALQVWASGGPGGSARGRPGSARGPPRKCRDFRPAGGGESVARPHLRARSSRPELSTLEPGRPPLRPQARRASAARSFPRPPEFCGAAVATCTPGRCGVAPSRPSARLFERKGKLGRTGNAYLGQASSSTPVPRTFPCACGVHPCGTLARRAGARR